MVEPRTHGPEVAKHLYELVLGLESTILDMGNAASRLIPQLPL